MAARPRSWPLEGAHCQERVDHHDRFRRPWRYHLLFARCCGCLRAQSPQAEPRAVEQGGAHRQPESQWMFAPVGSAACLAVASLPQSLTRLSHSTFVRTAVLDSAWPVRALGEAATHGPSCTLTGAEVRELEPRIDECLEMHPRPRGCTVGMMHHPRGPKLHHLDLAPTPQWHRPSRAGRGGGCSAAHVAGRPKR